MVATDMMARYLERSGYGGTRSDRPRWFKQLTSRRGSWFRAARVPALEPDLYSPDLVNFQLNVHQVGVYTIQRHQLIV